MTKHIFIISIISLLFSSNNLNAQKGAPDFTVTDIYGNTHKLYSDYLDKGKWVFLDFFGVWCGGCQAEAPRVDTVFRDFGCNYEEIVFLGIGTEPWEEYNFDSLTWDFTQKNSMTFPAVSGTTGGGHDVFVDYGLTSTPYNIFLDETGKIRFEHISIYDSKSLRDTIKEFGFTEKLCKGNNFIFYSMTSENDSIIGEINNEEKTIDILMPPGTDLTNLTANFINAINSTIEIDGTEQISGETINDFSNGALIYKITSETGETENWTVTVDEYSYVKYLEHNFKIYPNPTNGILIIENHIDKNIKNKDLTIYISDITGKIIKKIKLENNTTQVNLSNQEKGIYFINIKDKYNKITKKLVLY